MKNLYNVVLKDSPLDCPFAPNKKNGLFSWIPGIGPIIDTGLDMLGGLFTNESTNATNQSIADKNRVATAEANEKNIALQRETNAQNYQMFQEQNAFNLDMWNKQNEYNDPKAVVQRLLAAGLNPAGAFGQSAQAGQLSSATPNPAQAPKVVPEIEDWTAIPNSTINPIEGVSAFFQNQLLNKQVESVGLDNQAKQIDNQFKAFEKMANLLEQKTRIQESLSRKNLNDEQRIKLRAEEEQIDWTLSLFKDTYLEQKRSAKMNNDVMESQKQNYDSQTAVNKMEELWRPRLYASNIQLNGSQSAAALGAAAQAWEVAKTTYEERHHILPLKEIEQILTNGYIATEFNGTVSYERFIKDNKFQDARFAIRLLGEVLHALQTRLK